MAIQKFALYLTIGIGMHVKGVMSVSDYKPSEESAKDEKWGRITIKQYEVELDVPDSTDTRQAEIDALEAGVQKERAESQSRVNLLLDRISKLKAITHDVDADGVPV